MKHETLKHFRPLMVALALSAAVTAEHSYAQESNKITLQFANGQDDMSGILREYKDGRYLIDGAVGLVAIPSEGVTCVGNACPGGNPAQTADAAVVLRSKDGTLSFSGDLVEVTDTDYVISTGAAGQHSVPISLVTCEGSGCVEMPAQKFGSEIVVAYDGNTITGTLIGFKDGYYTLDVAVVGEVRVKADLVSCAGVGCN